MDNIPKFDLGPEEASKNLRPTVVDPRGLMKALANAANIPWGKCRRIVLELEVDNLPVLHVQCYLQELPEASDGIDLSGVDVQVSDKPILIDDKGQITRGE